MSHSFRKSLRLTLAASLILGLSAPMTTMPAYANLEEVLAPYPDDTLALVTISLDPFNWSYLVSRIASGAKVRKVAPDTAETETTSDENTDAATETSSDSSTEENSADSVSDNDDPESTKLPKEVQLLVEFLEKDLKFNPIFDGLLNIGSHLTLAYRPYPGTKGHLLFSLNLRSPQRVAELMDRFHDYVQKQGQQREFVKDRLGPAEFYSLRLPFEGQDVMGDFGRLHLAVSGNNLIGSISSDATLLKRMLYIQAVLPKQSGFKLANSPLFKPAQEALQDTAAWVWLDLKQGANQAENLQKLFSAPAEEPVEVIKAVPVEAAEASEDIDTTEVTDPDENAEPTDSTLTEDPSQQEPASEIVDQLTSLYRGLGLGVNIARDGVKIKSFVVPDQARLTPNQADYLKAVSVKPENALRELMALMPEDPLLLMAGQNLDVALSKAPPLDLPLEDLPFKEEDVRKIVKDVLNLDYRQDFVPLIDGRVALGLFRSRAENTPPQMIVYLGLKNGQEAAFDKLVQQQLKFSPDALETALNGEEEALSQTQQNMRELQEMIETNAIDKQGFYAPDLNSLKQELDARELNDWKELTNPVSGKTGIGSAVSVYEGMGPKPDVKLAGTVFYAPQGEKTEIDGQIRYEGYAVYGYDPAGKLLRFDNQNDEFETVVDNLPTAPVQPKPAPQALSPRKLESFMGSDIYALPLEQLEGAPEDLAKLQPVFARKGDVWMLALSPEALKSAIQGGRPENLERWTHQTETEDARGLFYLDVQGSIAQAKSFVGPFLPEDSFGKVSKALEPWKAIFAASDQKPQGTAGHLVFDVNLDELDLEAIGNLSQINASDDSEEDKPFQEFESSVDEQVNTNMHTVQALVETFAVNNEDIYPSTVAELIAAGRKEGYWRDVVDPQSTELVDAAEILLDYSQYQPGPEMASKVFYEPMISDGEVLSYRIYGTDENGELLIKDGEPYNLNNQSE